ncbi:MAG: NlpC/P60 family protein [Veillonellaceae bacterium]|nr:NlpC/P60 family protein [Veillonellaceae bacterium]MDY5331047.1 NlpC/P60 family protein [Anaerovibrio sp.]
MGLANLFLGKWVGIGTALCLSLMLEAGTAYAFQNLEKDARGPEVLQVQKQLQFLGYKIAKLDGSFDNSTYRAVMSFQRDQKIKITGVVDRKTFNAIQVARRNANLAGRVENIGGSMAGEGLDIEESWEALKGQGTNVPESQPFLARQQVPQLLTTAKKYIGVPYQFGGDTPKAFDCSGYLQYVFAQNGMKLPRTADLQYKLGKSMTVGKLEAGDLVFFTTYEPGASHCGIYLGQGEFIHASSSKGVRIDKLNDSYWKSKYYGGKHIVK